MLPYQLLALDIDGTLLNSRHEIAPRVQRELRRARDAGVRLVLATGRRYSRALPLVAPLELAVPLVTHGGALLKDPANHQTLYQARLADELLAQVVATCEAAGHDPLLYGDTYLQGFDYYCRRFEAGHPHLEEYLRKNAGCGRVIPGWSDDLPADVFAAFAMGTREEMSALVRRLREALPGALETLVLRSPFYAGFMCEIAPAGATKWSAVARLAAEWGIPRDAICAVGDDVNDLEMIRQAGLGVAMGNAAPEIQAAADRVAPTHDEDGVAEVIAWLLDDAQ